MKKRILIISSILLLIVGGLGFSKLNNDFLLLWNNNKFNVTADNPLSTDKVKIEFGVSVNTIDRPSDSALFENRNKYTVLFDGKLEDSMINEYGENDFLITYNDKYYFSFRQFKFNRRHQHDYNFHFFQKGDTVFVRADITGEDKMKFERPMHVISMATTLKCNSPIDNKKTIYNMVELVDPDKK